MKRSFALMGTTLAVCALACAQDSGNRVVIPGSHRIVEVNLISGSITVKTGSANEVVAEMAGSRNVRPSPPAPPGMHRVDTPWNAPIQAEVRGDTVQITTMPHGNGNNLIVTVPANTSVKLHTMHGDLNADGLRGEVDADTTHGEISLNNISGTVVANTTHGSIKVTMNQVDQAKPLSFTTMNGEIDVALPADIRSNVKLRQFHGEIWSDFDIKLNGTASNNNMHRLDGGRYQIMMDRTLNGTINGGGVEASFYTLNGKITIRKK